MAEREEFYEQLDEMGEAAVDRYVHLGHWTNTTEMAWAQAWQREQKMKREERALSAAEDSAEASKDSAKSAKTSARWAIWATLIAAAGAAWSVWGP